MKNMGAPEKCLPVEMVDTEAAALRDEGHCPRLPLGARTKSDPTCARGPTSGAPAKAARGWSVCMTLCLLVSSLTIAAGASESGKLSEMANRLTASGSKLVRNMELGKSSSQINDWLVHQVAPAMATKIIDNVLQAPGQKSGSVKKSKAAQGEPSIDTQALADRIVDKLADRIKKRKQATSNEKQAAESAAENSLPEDEQRGSKESNRRGKSLVSDTVQQVVQNFFNKDSRNFLGRAMEKPRFPLRPPSNPYQTQYQSHHNSGASNGSSFQLVREPAHEQPVFGSTDSSQLDENPVVLRAEHGHNSSSSAGLLSAHQHHHQQQQQHQGMMQNSLNIQNENLSPLISSLMSSTATNQLGNKLLQKHRHQQKHVHTNRHQQHQLAPKPWPSSAGGARRQQQSPYSLSVTSDINIVQAPSSPAPPVALSQANKFKINNRHQHPSASWQNSRSPYYNQPNSGHRHQHHHPASTSTTTTTTSTTTTTTTTPEPPQTESLMAETMESIEDLDNQTSAPVSSILSSVAQSALESLSQAASNSIQNSQDDSQSYSPYSNSSHSPAATSSAHSFSSSSSGTKGASPSSTSARHSVLSAEAIPTALGAPLYHLTRANFTTTSIMGPPPRRSGASPAAKAAAQYLQKSLNSISSTIFGRQNKNWARRLGLSSVLLSGLLYGAAILAKPGAPLPANGLEVLQALTTKKRRRGSKETLLPAIESGKLAVPALTGSSNAALMDLSNNMNILYQQPQLIPIIEHLIQQEQQQNSLFSQRSSLSSSPLEIGSLGDDQDRAVRRENPSQYFTIQAIPKFISELSQGEQDRTRKQIPTRRR